MTRALITGSPRSGTKYTTALLNGCGVHAVHELYFAPDSTPQQIIEWLEYPDPFLVEVSWFVWPLAAMLPDDVTIIHQVRDPWKTIDSLAHRCAITANPQPNEPATKWHAMDPYAHPLVRSAEFLLRWSAMIDALEPHGRVKVEHLNENGAGHLLKLLGIDPKQTPIAAAVSEAERQREVVEQRTLEVFAELGTPEANARTTRNGIETALPAELCAAVERLARGWGYE